MSFAKMRRLEGAGSIPGRTDPICFCSLSRIRLEQAMLRSTQPLTIRWMGNDTTSVGVKGFVRLWGW
jgi:hypothetical protein